MPLQSHILSHWKTGAGTGLGGWSKFGPMQPNSDQKYAKPNKIAFLWAVQRSFGPKSDHDLPTLNAVVKSLPFCGQINTEMNNERLRCTFRCRFCENRQPFEQSVRRGSHGLPLDGSRKLKGAPLTGDTPNKIMLSVVFPGPVSAGQVSEL